MPAAGWCGGTFFKPAQGSDNHWYLPNIPSAASDLIFSAPLQAASSLCKQGIYPSAVLADSLEHFPMWVCYTWMRVWWPLAWLAGHLHWAGEWGGSDTCIPDAPPGLGGLWAARTASPKAPSCRASSSWLPPPWELDDHGQLLWSPQGDLWHWQLTIWKCRLNTHMLSKTWHSQTYLFWYSSFLWNFFY